MYEPFSVLMSLYVKEKKEYFSECMESILNQTLMPDEIVIVLDGPINDEVSKTLKDYITKYPSLIKVVPLEKNMGLGLALREGILHCKNEVIARMDTDDVATSDRFEKQLLFFVENKLDLCSSHIKEFEKTKDCIIAERKVPLEMREIKKYQKYRSAFNHMAVMYSKTAVIKAGNYCDCPLMEDDLLWVNMILSGAVCKNIDDYLVYARTNSEMIARRGGLAYYKKYKNGRNIIRKTGYINYWQYKKTCMIQFVVCIMPSFIRKKIFFSKLHKKAGGK